MWARSGPSAPLLWWHSLPHVSPPSSSRRHWTIASRQRSWARSSFVTVALKFHPSLLEPNSLRCRTFLGTHIPLHHAFHGPIFGKCSVYTSIWNQFLNEVLHQICRQLHSSISRLAMPVRWWTMWLQLNKRTAANYSFIVHFSDFGEKKLEAEEVGKKSLARLWSKDLPLGHSQPRHGVGGCT